MQIRRLVASVRSPNRTAMVATRQKQAGYSLIEVGIVTAILLIISIIGIPAINGYVIENRTPKVAGELQRFVARTKASAQGAGPTPYAEINNVDNLAKALRNSSVVSIDADSGLVVHKLGGDGAGTSGVVTVEPAALGGGAMGNAFTLTLTDVNEAACPSMASLMQKLAEQMAINGTVVKQLGADNEAGDYTAVAAEKECAAGDSNEFVFTTR